MQVEIFDERRSILGESPTSSGLHNECISWVDVMGKKVRSHNLVTGVQAEFDTNEHLGFAIPRATGGYVVGEVSGPSLRDADGRTHVLPTREDADGYRPTQIVRWNDAKVSPLGDLFLGSMAYDFRKNAGALYQLRGDGKHMRRLFGDVTISNGMDWNIDGTKMYYIDTPLMRVDLFDVEEREIKNRRTFISFSPEMGAPDGMCVDAKGNLWVAFWLGHAVRCFDGVTGALLEEIICPAPRITSCTFGGTSLDQLFITSASENTDLSAYPAAGMVFVVNPGVQGQKMAEFAA
jgi:gluconolactonase